jgi:hypothetical protein
VAAGAAPTGPGLSRASCTRRRAPTPSEQRGGGPRSGGAGGGAARERARGGAACGARDSEHTRPRDSEPGPATRSQAWAKPCTPGGPGGAWQGGPGFGPVGPDPARGLAGSTARRARAAAVVGCPSRHPTWRWRRWPWGNPSHAMVWLRWGNPSHAMVWLRRPSRGGEPASPVADVASVFSRADRPCACTRCCATPTGRTKKPQISPLKT